jgi:hypothetical protein
MKRFLFITTLSLFFFGCERNEFDPNNPDVVKFVQQLKNGTYNFFEKGENGENLWLIMPKFTKDHIESLIDFSKDTTHINNFPINPISSRKPFPNERDYFILGECLLWTVEGIRNGSGFGSLDPYLIDTTSLEESKGLNGQEILIVRDSYQGWWNNFRDSVWKEMDPLDGTPYKWF